MTLLSDVELTESMESALFEWAKHVGKDVHINALMPSERGDRNQHAREYKSVLRDCIGHTSQDKRVH